MSPNFCQRKASPKDASSCLRIGSIDSACRSHSTGVLELAGPQHRLSDRQYLDDATQKYARDSRRHLSAAATDIAEGTVPLDEVISSAVPSESDHRNG
jgi:hypothetical protein